MKLNLVIEKKSFENSNEEMVDYFSYTTEIDGNKIRLKPVEEDKKLANYLLKNNYKGGNA